MPAAGTFDYVAIVPDDVSESGFECDVRAREGTFRADTDPHRARLVGAAPRLRVTDAGLTPDSGPRRPWVIRSLFTLSAAMRRQATVAEASFHLDRALTGCMRPGDEVYLARTGNGGLGVSVVRGGELIVAVGAVTAVPLGSQIVARVPSDLIAAAQAVFRERDPGFEFRECPIEVRISGSRSILYSGRRSLERYHLFAEHGIIIEGEPGAAECVAVWRADACPDVAAQSSAMLLDAPDALTMSRWP